MPDDDLDPRLAVALRDYSRGGVRPIDALAIARAAVGRRWLRRSSPGAPVARWQTWLWAPRIRATRLLTAVAAVLVVAVAGIVLAPSFGGIGGGSSAPPSPIPTATTSPSPLATSTDSPSLVQSFSVDGVSFSVRLPAPGPGMNAWATYGGLLVSKSIAGPQGAEGVVYWAGFAGGREADPCIDAPIERWTLDEVADYIASAAGTVLVTAPRDVTVGGYPATYVAVIVREDTGCDPGFFYSWKPQDLGMMWGETLPGDTIRVWLVQVGDRRLFIAAETHRDVRLDEPMTDAEQARLEQEIRQIVDSIRFE